MYTGNPGYPLRYNTSWSALERDNVVYWKTKKKIKNDLLSVLPVSALDHSRGPRKRFQ